MTVAEQLAEERPLLRAFADRFDATVVRVDSKALVTVRQNRYSVPVALAGLRVSVSVGASKIRIVHGKYRTRATLDHLELLPNKPGALARSLAQRSQRAPGSRTATARS